MGVVIKNQGGFSETVWSFAKTDNIRNNLLENRKTIEFIDYLETSLMNFLKAEDSNGVEESRLMTEMEYPFIFSLKTRKYISASS